MHLSPSEAHGRKIQRMRDKRSVRMEVALVMATTSNVDIVYYMPYSFVRGQNFSVDL